MTTKNPILSAVEEINESFESFKEKNDQALAAQTKQQDELLDRIERIEAIGDRPSKSGRNSESDSERRIEALGYIAKGMGLQQPELKAKGEKLLAEKAASGTSNLAGGNTIQTEIGAEIFPELRKEPGIYSLVRVTEIETAPSSYRRVVSSTGTDSGWVGETTSRTPTNTPDFNVAAPTGGMLYSYPSVTEELLNASVFAIGEFIVSEVQEDFRRQLATAAISGDGSNKPTGLTNAAPVSTEDDASPRRAFNILQYLPTGAASGFETEPYQQPSPMTDPFAVFWNTMAALKSQYRRNANWVMNSTTLAALGKLRDVDGKSLFSPNPAAGVPMSLLGYPVVIDEYVADLGSNTFPVFFGDFDAGYEIASNFDTRITIDDISTKGYTAFYIRTYLGGCVTRGEGVKVIKCATS